MHRHSALLGVIAIAWLAAGCGTEARRIVDSRPATDASAFARTMETAGLVGPRICFSSDIVDHCYPDGGYCICEERIVTADIPAGRVLTLHWTADPQPGLNVRWYRWAVDIEDIFDNTPRIDEETDLAHWSQRSATALSAQLGPWNSGEVHMFHLEVEDDFGLRSLGSIRFTVGPATNQPPDCSAAAPDRDLLWPPDHRLVPVSIEGVTDPDGDPITIQVTRVTQDESPVDRPFGAHDRAMDAAVEEDAGEWAFGAHSPDDEGGIVGDHGRRRRTCPDATIHPEGGRVKLRAERSARGDGRIYTIWFTASDPSGASSEGSVRVCVPHDRRHRECGDGGQIFDSLGPCGVRGRGPQAFEP